MGLIKELEQFGLENKKARVYVALLELGTAKVFEIAKKADVERPTAYDILMKLAQDGLAGYFEKRGIRYYVAEDPEKIKGKLQEKMKLFDQILPSLKSIHNSLVSKPAIKFYEGVEGIKTVLEDTLTTKDKRLLGILSVIDLFIIPGKEFMKGHVTRRIQSRIHLRVIRSRPKDVKEYWPSDSSELRELRYALEPMIFAMTMYLYDNKVALISSRKENFGMIIESEEYSQNMRHLFEALWHMSTLG